METVYCNVIAIDYLFNTQVDDLSPRDLGNMETDPGHPHQPGLAPRLGDWVPGKYRAQLVGPFPSFFHV